MPFRPGLLVDKELPHLRQKLELFAEPFAASPAPVPEWHDVRSRLLESSDQGDSSMCAAFAMASCIEYYNWKELGVKEQVDPVPIYKAAKAIDGYPDEEGTTLDAVIKAAKQLSLAPIDLTSLTGVFQSPGQNLLKRALHHYDVLLGAFQITPGWIHATKDGWIPDDDGNSIGGHAVAICAYADDETKPWFGFQNSWGYDGYGWRGFVRLDQTHMEQQFLYAITWEYLK